MKNISILVNDINDGNLEMIDYLNGEYVSEITENNGEYVINNQHKVDGEYLIECMVRMGEEEYLKEEGIC